MTQEDYKYRQGRSKRQYDANQKIMMISAAGLLILFVVLIIVNLIEHGI